MLPGKQQKLLVVEQQQCSLMRALAPQRSGLQVWRRISYSPGEAEVASMSLVPAPWCRPVFRACKWPRCPHELWVSIRLGLCTSFCLRMPPSVLHSLRCAILCQLHAFYPSIPSGWTTLTTTQSPRAPASLRPLP